MKIDNRKYKDQFHTKAQMIKPEELVELNLAELELTSKSAGWIDVSKLISGNF